VKGGFYFHPTDKDLSAGTPERKKPLGLVLSVYTNSENAIAAPEVRQRSYSGFTGCEKRPEFKQNAGMSHSRG
jgi:hypothetical protein